MTYHNATLQLHQFAMQSHHYYHCRHIGLKSILHERCGRPHYLLGSIWLRLHVIIKLTSILSIAATAYHWMGQPTANWEHPVLISTVMPGD